MSGENNSEPVLFTMQTAKWLFGDYCWSDIVFSVWDGWPEEPTHTIVRSEEGLLKGANKYHQLPTVFACLHAMWPNTCPAISRACHCGPQETHTGRGKLPRNGNLSTPSTHWWEGVVTELSRGCRSAQCSNSGAWSDISRSTVRTGSPFWCWDRLPGRDISRHSRHVPPPINGF